MYSVSPELYCEVAERLLDAVGSRGYYSGTIAFDFAGTACRLTTSVMIYRERVSLPDCDAEAIVDVVPVWWEFHTLAAGEEILNDFSFCDLRRFVR